MNNYAEWAFKTLIVAISAFTASQFTEMKDSVVELNKQMAIVVTKIAYQNEQIKENKIEIKEIKGMIKHGY